MTPDRLQKMRELNEARNKGVKQSFDCISFLYVNADWLLSCVEALQWYADEKNWRCVSEFRGSKITFAGFVGDGGTRARSALEAKEN